jgi:hypothetical protein
MSETMALFPEWISSAEGSRASRSPSPGNGRRRRTIDSSGRTSLELLNSSDPIGSLLRTSLESDASRPTGSLVTWKRSATPSGRLWWVLSMQALHTDGNEFSLLPTLTAQSSGSNRGGAAGRVGPIRPSLETMARSGMLSTPTARDWKSGKGALKGKKAQGGPSLSAQSGGQLNPEFAELLMGFPLGWTALEPSEMPLSRKSRK